MDKKLDALLDLYEVAPPDALLMARILEKIPADPVQRRSRYFGGLRVACVLIFTIMAATGFWLGDSSVSVQRETADSGYFDALIMGPASMDEMTL